MEILSGPGTRFMHIRYGCELKLAVQQATPAFCRVDVHPERRIDIVEEYPLAVGVRLKTDYDTFGNILQRWVMPVGETTLALSGVVMDSGQLDFESMAWS